MAAVTVPAAYKKLVTVLAHMFYSGQCPPAWWVDAADPKKPDSSAADELGMFEEKKAAQLAREAKRKQQQDTKGLGIVLLGAMVERQWVEEDELARSLNLPAKMVRRAMRFLEQEQLVVREHRKESVRGRRKEREMLAKAGLRGDTAAATAAAAATSGSIQAGQAGAAGGDLAGLPPEEEEEPISKGHVISYCALDYPRIVDSVRWRIATMKRNLHKEIRGGNAVQLYKCPVPDCGKEYSSMDVFELLSRDPGGGGRLTCGICGTEIEMVLDEGGKQLGSMEDKKERIRKARAMLEACDTAMAPLTQQLAAIEGLEPPDFDSYANWLTKQVATRQRLQGIANQSDAASAAHKPSNQPAPAITSNTQVVLNFKSSSSGSGNGPGSAPAGDGTAAAPTTGSASRQAAAATAAAAATGPTAAAGAGNKPPPWMAPRAAAAAAQAPPAAKPIPPWLLSSVKASHQQQLVQHQQQQQQRTEEKAAFAGSLLAGLKGDIASSGAAGLKPDPGFGGTKIEVSAVKPDASKAAATLQGHEAEEDDEWEDVGGSSQLQQSWMAAAGTAANDAQIHLNEQHQHVKHDSAAADGADDDDWEDV